MNAPTPPTADFDWLEANQRLLSAEIARVRTYLESATAGQAPSAPAAAAGRPAGLALQPGALERVSAVFGLSPFERDVLLLCAGVELDSACAAQVTQAQAGRPAPTFGLALAALPEAHWSALGPAAPLRRWHLVEVGAGHALAASPLRIDERMLHYLAGSTLPDERLQGVVQRIAARSLAGGKGAPIEAVPSQGDIVERLVAGWSASHMPPPLPVVFLCSPRSAGTARPHHIEIATAACNRLGTGLYRLNAADIPSTASERELLARLWEREAALDGLVLLLDALELERPSARPAGAFLETLNSAVIVACHEPLALTGRPVLSLEVANPSSSEQRQLWQNALGPLASQWNGNLEALVSQFNLGPASIHRVVAQSASSEPSFSGVWEACRQHSRRQLEGAEGGQPLAQRIESAASWNDLVLPELQCQTLHEIVAQVRQRARVYDTWGMARRGARSLGISALFAGPSGTGKTLAAEVLANELHLDLYRVDLSAVVSKYIGETEKNLRQVFDAAEEGGAILLFDEADALFGKRSEVKDSHDRYANVEVSYLLQRMEAYGGLAILTSNLKSALDPAFMRRLRFVVGFPFPDAAQRAAIWQRMFPPQTPTAGLEAGKLARLNIAGGNIRNIALNAAFLAAEANEAVDMHHILRAARSEYAKLEKTITEAEIAGWNGSTRRKTEPHPAVST